MTKVTTFLCTFIDKETGELADITAPNESAARLRLGGDWILESRAAVRGVFATGYGKIFGRHFVHLTNRDHVVGKFNAHSAESCLNFADEALFVGNARDADILKTPISEETKMIERKGINSVPV